MGGGWKGSLTSISYDIDINVLYLKIAEEGVGAPPS